MMSNNNTNTSNNNNASSSASSSTASHHRRAPINSRLQIPGRRLSISGPISPVPGTPTTPQKKNELLCPICHGFINEAFMTKCGHSFCFLCISRHLENKHSCPVCSAPVVRNEIFPNFSLNEVVNAVKNSSASMPGQQQNKSDDITTNVVKDMLGSNQSNISLAEIDKLVSALVKMRKKMESSKKEMELEVLAEFLTMAREHKVKAIERLTAQLKYLESDLDRIDDILTSIESDSDTPSTPSPSVFQRQRMARRASVTTELQQLQQLHLQPQQPSPQGPNPALLNRRKRSWQMLHDDGGGASTTPLTMSVTPPVTPMAPSTSSSSPAAGLTATPSTPPPTNTLNNNNNNNSSLPPFPPQTRRRSVYNYSSAVSPTNPVMPTSASTATVTTPLSPTPAELIAFEKKKLKIQQNFEDLQKVYFDMCERARLVAHHRAALSLASEQTATSPLSPPGSVSSPLSDPTDNGGVVLKEFSDFLVKFTRYDNLRVITSLRYGDIFTQNTSSNIVSSIEFDRDEEFFATAGVTKKIKIYDYNEVIKTTNNNLHYPVCEFSNPSKLSCLSWNPYIKAQIASSDYEGVVALWDVNTKQRTQSFEEHEKRVWSIDFAITDPTRLASGSDDGKLKIWNINHKESVITIDSKANICCVSFNPQNCNHVAFGSADHNIQYYDLRNYSAPMYIFKGHTKAVSYVKFMNNGYEFVSASTDSTLKLWDMQANCCSRTFMGHINKKNFVGLSVNGDYIACGSETNAVHVYYKNFPKPIINHQFVAATKDYFGSASSILSDDEEDEDDIIEDEDEAASMAAAGEELGDEDDEDEEGSTTENDDDDESRSTRSDTNPSSSSSSSSSRSSMSTSSASNAPDSPASDSYLLMRSSSHRHHHHHHHNVHRNTLQRAHHHHHHRHLNGHHIAARVGVGAQQHQHHQRNHLHYHHQQQHQHQQPHPQQPQQQYDYFVSSLCWRRRSNTLLCANSQGIINVMSMV